MVKDTNTQSLQQGLGFKDVAIRPRASNYRMSEVKTTAQISKNIQLRRPIIGAPVPCISNEAMAIALAMSGGIGVVHRYQTPEAQAQTIKTIKDKVSSFIRPIQTILPGTSVLEAKDIIEKNSLPVLPVIDARSQFIKGIIQPQLIEQNADQSALVADIMISPATSKIKNGMSERHYREVFEQQGVAFMIVVDKSDRVMGLMTADDVLQADTTPVSSKDKNGRLMVGAAIGVDDEQRAKSIIEAGADAIFIESLNAHNKNVLKAVTSLRRMSGDYKFDVIVGNIATKDGARAVIDAGADAVVVGIGSCEQSTVLKGTGVGVPSISALMDVYAQCQLSQTPVIFGGVSHHGDVLSKAFAAGASGVMLGQVLAGCAESPADVKIHNNITYKLFQPVSRYYESGHIDYGESQYVQNEGSVKDLVEGVSHSIKRTLTLTGCLTLKDLAEQSEFIRISAN